MSMEDMAEYLPIRFQEFSEAGEGNETHDEVVLADVTDTDNGVLEIGFTIGRKRRYVTFRAADLRRHLPDEETSP